ncbi:MAG: hypothetical protein QOJ99_924 [Bryobacterales bacterium]|jgi:uncharacterized membrane protein YcaP (DUF421 family)|nr:hypothetical protein [Bryobacterales bacterium]
MTTVVHAIAGYFFMLLVLRVLARRPGSQMTPSDFVLVFLIGGVVLLATMENDRSETNAVLTVITVGICHRIVSHLKQRFPRVGALIDGTPLVLLKDGKWQTEAMGKAHVTDDDVMAAARSKGAKTLSQVKYAILERNGGISIIKNNG